MGPVAAILGGICGTLGFVFALVFFDVTWAGAFFAYFLCASGTFGALVILCSTDKGPKQVPCLQEESKSHLAAHS